MSVLLKNLFRLLLSFVVSSQALAAAATPGDAGWWTSVPRTSKNVQTTTNIGTFKSNSSGDSGAGLTGNLSATPATILRTKAGAADIIVTVPTAGNPYPNVAKNSAPANFIVKVENSGSIRATSRISFTVTPTVAASATKGTPVCPTLATDWSYGAGCSVVSGDVIVDVPAKVGATNGFVIIKVPVTLVNSTGAIIFKAIGSSASYYQPESNGYVTEYSANNTGTLTTTGI